MVMALHRSGLRVIQDVVFNHTAGFGQSDGGSYRQVLVVINSTTKQQAVTDRSLLGHLFVLHPEQQQSADPTAVFVQMR